MTHYDSLMGLADYGNLPLDQLPFTTATHHDNECGFESSFKEYLWRKYQLLDVRRNIGVSLPEWTAQPMSDINRQINMIPEVLEERKRIMDNLNNK